VSKLVAKLACISKLEGKSVRITGYLDFDQRPYSEKTVQNAYLFPSPGEKVLRTQMRP
jgi:hypothetical protein